MANAFSICPRDFTPTGTLALRDYVAGQTGSDVETESILRSLERYGSDSSVRYFDVTPAEVRLGLRTLRAASWNVRAVRF